MVNLLEKRRRLIISTSNLKQIQKHFAHTKKVLLHISNKPSDAYIIEKKRDTLTVIITGLFLLTVLLVGRKVGLQSILSLILNSIAILIAIYIHIQHSNINLFLLMTIAMICSTILTLLLVTGWHMRTPHYSCQYNYWNFFEYRFNRINHIYDRW